MLGWLACHSPGDTGEWHKMFKLFSESSSCYKRLASCTAMYEAEPALQCHHGLVDMLSVVLSPSLVHYEHQSYPFFWGLHSYTQVMKLVRSESGLNSTRGYRVQIFVINFVLLYDYLDSCTTCMWLVHCFGGVCTLGCTVKEKLTMNVFYQLVWTLWNAQTMDLHGQP